MTITEETPAGTKAITIYLHNDTTIELPEIDRYSLDSNTLCVVLPDGSERRWPRWEVLRTESTNPHN